MLLLLLLLLRRWRRRRRRRRLLLRRLLLWLLSHRWLLAWTPDLVRSQHVTHVLIRDTREARGRGPDRGRGTGCNSTLGRLTRPARDPDVRRGMSTGKVRTIVARDRGEGMLGQGGRRLRRGVLQGPLETRRRGSGRGRARSRANGTVPAGRDAELGGL